MIDNMPEKTAKSLNEWKKVLKTKSFTKHSEAVNFLKKEHHVTHGFTNTIVIWSKKENESPLDLVQNQYQGKEDLLPIYDKLLTVVKEFCDDVTITPKKASVSIIRKKTICTHKTRIQNPNKSRAKIQGQTHKRKT